MSLPQAVDPNSGFDYAPGTMTAQEQQNADRNLIVQFYIHPVLDQIATEGGIIHKHHPRLKEFRDEGREIRELSEDDGPGCRGHYQIPPAGRPIFRDAEFIRIIIPGDKDRVIERPVEKADTERFAASYKRWKAGLADEARGTPLSTVPFLTPSQREELAYFEIRTAEQLATVSDEVCSRVRGLLGMRERAKLWIDASKGDASAKYDAVMKQKDAEMQDLKAALAEMQKQLADLSARKK